MTSTSTPDAPPWHPVLSFPALSPRTRTFLSDVEITDYYVLLFFFSRMDVPRRLAKSGTGATRGRTQF